MTANLLDKFKNMLGLNDELIDENDDLQDLVAESEASYQKPQQSNHVEEMHEDLASKRKKMTKQSNIIDFSSPPSNEMIVVEPGNYDDAIKVVSLLKSKVAVIISFINSTLSHEDTMHIIDFICGAVCAIDGNQKIVAPGVYLFTPGNINIGSLDSEQTQNRSIDKSGNNLFLTINDVSFNKKKVTKVS